MNFHQDLYNKQVDLQKTNLNIGCGNTRIPGYQGVDIIPGPCTDIVATADSLPFKDNSVDEVLAEHLIEHLTFHQFNKAITEWHRVLKPEGKLIIECPDLLGICKQFVEGNEYSRYCNYKGYWPTIMQAYGHQKGSNEQEIMSQVHKSGYTFEHLEFVLSGVGFIDIEQVPYQKGPPGQAIIRLVCYKQ